MIVEEGKKYECTVCKCELTATKSPPESCPKGDCELSCCGERMQEKE